MMDMSQNYQATSLPHGNFMSDLSDHSGEHRPTTQNRSTRESRLSKCGICLDDIATWHKDYISLYCCKRGMHGKCHQKYFIKGVKNGNNLICIYCRRPTRDRMVWNFRPKFINKMMHQCINKEVTRDLEIQEGQLSEAKKHLDMKQAKIGRLGNNRREALDMLQALTYMDVVSAKEMVIEKVKEVLSLEFVLEDNVSEAQAQTYLNQEDLID
jgi:hypothetical protein